jgi:hypothetical protein
MFNKLFFIAVALLLFTSCKKTRGCTDSEALNYNPDAAKDDRSCYYYWIGQNYGGGKVFYIDVTKKHGLIAADFDIGGDGYKWGGLSEPASGADGTIVGTGYQNTVDIVNAYGEGTAAYACFQLDTMGYDDWYLPSKEELKGFGSAFGEIAQGNILGSYYSCSSEFDTDNIWTLYGGNFAITQTAKTTICATRPIRSF